MSEWTAPKRPVQPKSPASVSPAAGFADADAASPGGQRGRGLALLARIGDVVLTTESAQRLRISRSLLAAGLYAGILLSFWAAVLLGLIERDTSVALMLCVASGPVVFYALLRSGWNRRLAEPALTLAQMIFAVAALMVGYFFAVPIRAALLLILAMVMAFGMFSLTPDEARRLTRFAVAGFGSLMAGLALTRPEVYDPRLELIHLLLMTSVLLVIGTLSSQFSRLRSRLREQRAALRDALGRLETLARRDALTGLVNRRCMGELLDAEQRRRRSNPAPACVCAIDLDHFKRVNDVFGHAAGDAVLQRFANVAESCLRSIDVLARWGGEEFLLLLPGTDAAQAGALLERLREALAEPATWHDEPGWRVTFSAGVTDWRPGEAAEPAIERADRAAYAAKAQGRNRWCFG